MMKYNLFSLKEGNNIGVLEIMSQNMRIVLDSHFSQKYTQVITYLIDAICHDYDFHCTKGEGMLEWEKISQDFLECLIQQMISSLNIIPRKSDNT